MRIALVHHTGTLVPDDAADSGQIRQEIDTVSALGIRHGIGHCNISVQEKNAASIAAQNNSTGQNQLARAMSYTADYVRIVSLLLALAWLVGGGLVGRRSIGSRILSLHGKRGQLRRRTL